MNALIDNLGELLRQGGKVMWPLMVLSLMSVTLIFERCWFWMTTNSSGRKDMYRRVARHLREGRRDQAAALIENDRSIYARVVRQLLEEGTTDAVATDAIESQRTRIERFMPTLGTIITAAPMLGILGTVLGIISAFNVLAKNQILRDPSEVGAGIAEAMIATVAGLVVALFVLFPYNAFRAQIDRSVGQMQTLIAAAQSQNEKEAKAQDTKSKAEAAATATAAR